MSTENEVFGPAGVEGQEPLVQQDYFGFQHLTQHFLPDGVSYFELSAMNEGQKAVFQKSTQRDLVLEKGSGNARLKVDPGGERHALIKASVVGWNLMRQGQPIMFTQRSLDEFLKLADPKVVEDLESAIRKLNPWLLAELTVEEIDRQIEELQELRGDAVKREEGEASSSSK